MGVFQELDPEVHLKLIEGYRDELTPEQKSDDLFYEIHRKCKRCGCEMHKEIDVRVAWQAGRYLPKALLRCENCGFLIEPFTGLVVESGDASKIPHDTVPVLEEE